MNLQGQNVDKHLQLGNSRDKNSKEDFTVIVTRLLISLKISYMTKPTILFLYSFIKSQTRLPD